ncbi:MAG: nitrous oxide reductase accessory protein NosL [Ignavibacteria bacterium]|jgi:copper chaperone NosL|nr:nitrous oxide reductase accessory protein NosL [Ignavibacteria bacterium]
MIKYLNYYNISILLTITIFSIFTGCKIEPEPIDFGKDTCDHCRMMISDNRYGAELITDKGKIYKYDSIECLIDYALGQNIIGESKQNFLIVDFSQPEKLVNARTAFYVHNNEFRSPMGLNVSAFENETDLQVFIKTNGGKKLSWPEVIELTKQ